MSSDNWIVEILTKTLSIWSEKLNEVFSIVTTSPEQFRSGEIFKTVSYISNGLESVAYALLVLFFCVGVVKTSSTFTDLKRPEHAVKLFIRFALAKAAVTYSKDLMEAILDIIQSVISSIMSSSGVSSPGILTLPDQMVEAIEGASFLESVPLWCVSLICCFAVWALSFLVVITVYGRFFRLYMYSAIAPIPLSSFAGEPTHSIGLSFIKSYACVCLEGAVIVLSCVIFSCFASTVPDVDLSSRPAVMVWQYMAQLIFNLLILTGSVKMADRLTHEMMGI